MNLSFKIGNAFGIPVRIHATFLLLIYVLYISTPDPLLVLGATGVSFGCVLLHELGHSLVARNFGLRVADITLWPLGGIARMSEIPENSRIEGLIAIAGPAVNFALAGLAILGLFAGHALGLEDDSLPHGFLLVFTGINLAQGGFNLLPAFPMDGGRLLRAFLGRKRDWLRATESAVRVGRIVALLLLIGALLLMREGRGSCILMLIPLFIWFEGTRELWGVRLRHGATPFGAGFGFRPSAPTPSAPSAPAAPLPDTADAGERGVARRPQLWQKGDPRAGGFNEDQVRWLEAYRGRLRPPPEEP